MYLWPKVNDCRILVSDSGIDASQIDWDEPPSLRWQSVLFEAEKQGSLHILVPVLLARYAGNKQLQEACAPWMPNGESTERGEKAAVMMEPVKLVPVIVPEEFAELAADNTVATIDSLRMVVVQQQRQIDEILAWRLQISQLAVPQMPVKLDTAPLDEEPLPVVPLDEPEKPVKKGKS